MKPEPIVTTEQGATALPTYPPLTKNETRLLEWLAAGRTNEQMARCANRSCKTVSNQLTRVYAKLGVVNRTEAVAVFLRGGGGGWSLPIQLNREVLPIGGMSEVA